MDYSSWINTSLDLNINSYRVHEEAATKKEVDGNFCSPARKPSVKEDVTQSPSALVEELKRVGAENKKLTKMLREICENYNALRSQLMEYMRRNPEKELSPSKKRKSDSSNNNSNLMAVNGNSEGSSTDEEASCKKPREETIKAKICRVYVRSKASDTSLIVKDGYQWRKYGQKVTRDNPCPRAYFKCSFAPSCPVKKKVQRSVDDQSIVVATYEGEHNHPVPTQMEATSGNTSRCVALGSAACSASLNSSGPTLGLELTKSKSSNDSKNLKPKIDTSQVPQNLVEQMATSLTRDPNFRAALLAAISGKMLQ